MEKNRLNFDYDNSNIAVIIYEKDFYNSPLLVMESVQFSKSDFTLPF